MFQSLSHLFALLAILLGPAPLSLALPLGGRGPRGGLIDCGIQALIAWITLQAGVAVFAGGLGHFTLGFIVLIETLVFLSGLIFCRRFAIVVGLKHPAQASFGRVSGLLALPLFALALTLAALSYILVHPITDFDSLWYHLPVMAHWYQNGNFSTVPYLTVDQIGRYPFTWEAIAALFILPLNSDMLVALPSLLAWLLLGLVIYALGVRGGASSLHAAAAALLFSAQPLVIEHINTMHVDIPLAALFLSGLYCIAVYVVDRSPAYLIFAASAMLLLPGLKMSGIAYAGLLALVLAGVLATRWLRPQRHSFDTGPSQIATLVYGLVCLGSGLGSSVYWYLRNFREVGNPLGYVAVHLGSVSLWPGVIEPAQLQQTTLAHLFRFSDLSHLQVLVSQVWEHLGIPAVLLVTLALLLPAVAFARTRSLRLSTTTGALLALMLTTGLLYWTTPYSADNIATRLQITPWMGLSLRFAFPCLALIAVAAALSATTLKLPSRAVTAVTLVAALSSPGDDELVIGTLGAAALLLAGALLLGRHRRSLQDCSQGKRLALALAAVLLGALVLRPTFSQASEQRSEQRTEDYGAVARFLAANTAGGEPVGYLLTEQNYVLYDDRLTTRLVWVESISPDLRYWVNSLRQRNIRFVVVGPLSDVWRGKREISWLEDPYGPFLRVYGGEVPWRPVVYRLTDRAVSPIVPYRPDGWAGPVVISSRPDEQGIPELEPGVPSYASIAVKNLNDGPASGSAAVSLYLDEALIYQLTTPSLGAGQQAAATAIPASALSAGWHSVKMTAQDEFIGAATRETIYEDQFYVKPRSTDIPAPELRSPERDTAGAATLETVVRWAPAPGATHYQVEVMPVLRDGPMVDVVRQVQGQPDQDVSYLVPAPVFGSGPYILLPDMTYTWRVRASQSVRLPDPGDSQWGPWSRPGSFHTPPRDSAGIHPATPAPGAPTQTLTPLLQWNNDDREVFYYEVQLSTDLSFGSGPAAALSTVQSGLVHGGASNPPNSWQPDTLRPGATYYWRVRPRVQGDGAPVAWSPVWSFTTP